MPESFTAERFVERLTALQSDEEREKLKRYFKFCEGDEFLGVKMGQLFELAKEFISMDLVEVEKLMESPVHEIRAGALSIMDKQGRSNKVSASHREELFNLYIRRHDRINNWDLVDLAAPHVVGRYLMDRPRDILYRLAESGILWERRTAIVSTYYFIKQNQVDDTFAIAEKLVNDPEDLIHKAVGGWIREAGKRDLAKLTSFLDRFAATMPRVMLRYAIEHLDKPVRDAYLGLKKG